MTELMTKIFDPKTVSLETIGGTLTFPPKLRP